MADNYTQLFKADNLTILRHLYKNGVKADVVYADCIYEDPNFAEWIDACYDILDDNGIIYIQTDYHTVAEMKTFLDIDWIFINWLIYVQEWGGTSKRFFPRKHDDILMYAKGNNYKFYPERIQIPKATAGTAFDKKGTGLKTPCDVFYDLGNFSTISKERIKIDGKNVQWQKPLKLMNRLLLSTTDVGDLVIDPFMGTGTTGEWCLTNQRHFIGIEKDETIYSIARKRLTKL